MKIDETPRETGLYRKLAKDYTPKAAEMKICQYVERLEERIVALEASNNELEERIAALEVAVQKKTAKASAAKEKEGG